MGEAAPALALQRAEGGEFLLQNEYRDHPVLLAFVSDRCKPCAESLPALEKLSRDFGSKNQLALISVFFGRGGLDQSPAGPGADTETWAETLLLGDDSTARAYDVFGTPVFLLVGREGRVLWRHVGRLTPGAVDPVLEAALAAVTKIGEFPAFAHESSLALEQTAR